MAVGTNPGDTTATNWEASELETAWRKRTIRVRSTSSRHGDGSTCAGIGVAMECAEVARSGPLAGDTITPADLLDRFWFASVAVHPAIRIVGRG